MHAASQNSQPRADGREKKDFVSMFLLRLLFKSMLLDVYREFICFCSIPAALLICKRVIGMYMPLP